MVFDPIIKLIDVCLPIRNLPSIYLVLEGYWDHTYIFIWDSVNGVSFVFVY